MEAELVAVNVLVKLLKSRQQSAVDRTKARHGEMGGEEEWLIGSDWTQGWVAGSWRHTAYEGTTINCRGPNRPRRRFQHNEKRPRQSGCPNSDTICPNSDKIYLTIVTCSSSLSFFLVFMRSATHLSLPVRWLPWLPCFGFPPSRWVKTTTRVEKPAKWMSHFLCCRLIKQSLHLSACDDINCKWSTVVTA
jgi:hypothetical protein